MNKIHLIHFSVFLLGVFLLSCQSPRQEANTSNPNIILILADDLGYGDLSCYNQAAKISTPHLDKLANSGIRFTDAHSPSAVCTPTRYSLLTGRYSWRTNLKKGVLWSYGAPLIDSTHATIATDLKQLGYITSVIGKWHLGLQWSRKSFAKDSTRSEPNGLIRDIPYEWLDFTKPLEISPNDHGFDYSYVLPASLDIPPYTYYENKKIVGQLTSYTDGNELDNGASGAFWRSGLMSTDFSFEGVMPGIFRKAEEWIASQSKKPFFLYLPLSAPHTPWLPTNDGLNKSQAGKYGDFISSIDHEIGKFMTYLDNNGYLENTIVIFTSDNGPYWWPKDVEKYNHHAAGDYRGLKGDIWDGGHRVPFIISWKNVIPKGLVSNELFSLIDVYPSLLSYLDEVRLPSVDGRDISNTLFQGEKIRKPSIVIHHSAHGLFALRKNQWKLIEGIGSGGFTPQDSLTNQGSGQLYDLSIDPQEHSNLYSTNPEIVYELSEILDDIRTN